MNLLKTLQTDFKKATVDSMVRYIGNDAERFEQLMKAFLSGPYRITQRAAWPLSYCVEAHPSLIKPHLKAVILNLKKPNTNDSIKRNTLRLLQFVDIPKNLHAITISICFSMLENKNEAIAIKVFAMTVLANVCRAYPDIQKELITVIEDQMPYGSAGFRSRATKILKRLKH